MFDASIKKEPAREQVLVRPGLVSIVAFPLFAVIICLIIAIITLIHYPQTLNGRVLFTNFNLADKLVTVEIDVPENNLYDIDVGQPIQLRMADYPYGRFGILEGQIKYIYGETANNNIMAQVYLPHGLMTSKRQSIRYNYALKADALIIIRDMRLAQRIFSGPIRSGRQK